MDGAFGIAMVLRGGVSGNPDCQTAAAVHWDKTVLETDHQRESFAYR